MGYVTRQSKLRERLQQQGVAVDGGVTEGGAAGLQTRTKKMALFEDSIDPTPVVRLFFLQLLLRSKFVEFCLYEN